jgi:hypothetical protein
MMPEKWLDPALARLVLDALPDVDRIRTRKKDRRA